jgi:hypothetical protein
MRKLLPEVARKYQLGTHHTRVISHKYGPLDLCQLSLAKADEYVKAGDFPYLVLKPKKASKKKV